VKKELIGLAGEMRVCAELLKKGHIASITHGNSKATDIIVLDSESSRFLRIEVKTSRNGKNFLNGFYPKYEDSEKLHPDIWVFYLPDRQMSSSGDRFYLAKHEEVSRLQLIVNQGRVTKSGEGCDNIPLKIIDSEIEEGNWGLL
jgi:hypothetical protein